MNLNQKPSLPIRAAIVKDSLENLLGVDHVLVALERKQVGRSMYWVCRADLSDGRRAEVWWGEQVTETEDQIIDALQAQLVTLAEESDELKEYDLSHERWREYEWTDCHGNRIVYPITGPRMLFIRPGGSTHRVSDINGVTHCVPAPEVYGCALRWYNKESYSRCEF